MTFAVTHSVKAVTVTLSQTQSSERSECSDKVLWANSTNAQDFNSLEINQLLNMSGKLCSCEWGRLFFPDVPLPYLGASALSDRLDVKRTDSPQGYRPLSLLLSKLSTGELEAGQSWSNLVVHHMAEGEDCWDRRVRFGELFPFSFLFCALISPPHCPNCYLFSP